MPYVDFNFLESKMYSENIMGMEEIYSSIALPCTPSTLIELAFKASLYSRSMPCLTASRTLSTVAFGANRGLVPSWNTLVRARIEYQLFSVQLSNLLVPRMSDSDVSPAK